MPIGKKKTYMLVLRTEDSARKPKGNFVPNFQYSIKFIWFEDNYIYTPENFN